MNKKVNKKAGKNMNKKVNKKAIQKTGKKISMGANKKTGLIKMTKKSTKSPAQTPR
jgi:hypothetical protein